MKKLLSSVMVAMIVVQVTSPLLLNASEIFNNSTATSEVSLFGKDDKSSENETASEVSYEANSSGDEREGAVSQFTDFSGIGNQNTSDIGKATYIPPNEETEDRLMTIEEMEAIDSSMYTSVTDLDEPLIDAAVSGKVLDESIMFNEYDGREDTWIDNDIAGRTTWTGDCWEGTTGPSRYINTNVVQSDTCDVSVTDYGYHYNISDMTYEPIDLKLTIDYVDFFNSPLEADVNDARLIIRLDHKGIGFSTNRTNEVEFSTEFTNKAGTVINVPTFYELTDVDGGSGLGVAKDDLLGIATYYQDESNPTSGDYEQPYLNAKGEVDSDQSVFNYQSFYDYVNNNELEGILWDNEFEVGTYLRDNDRSIYNDIDPAINGNGTYTAEDRGWNRIKFYENGDFITILDSWGSNSGHGSTYERQKLFNMTTNGKDSTFVVELNSSSTMTSNMQDEFLGWSPQEKGLGQGWAMKPYSFVGETLINKEVEDASGDGIAQRGEELEYTVSVKNISQTGTIQDTQVRDSNLEAITNGEIDYLSWDGNFELVDATNGTELTSKGFLGDGSFTIDAIPPKTDARISYTLTVEDIPEGLFSIDNVATDNGDDPKDKCDSTTGTINCDGTETPTEETGNPIIAKTVIDEDGDGIIRGGETVEYTVTVTNDSDYPAYTIEIKDSMLQDTPEWLTFNNDETIVTNPDGMVVSGTLAGGDLVVDTLEPGDSISITYSLTADRPLPDDITEVSNAATDDGTDPIDPDTGLPIICPDVTEDCADTTTPVAPDKPTIDPTQAETTIEKSVVDENGNGIIEAAETLTYTIEVTNPEEIVAHDVVVRDSMVEDTPEWLTFNDDVLIDPSDIGVKGSLEDGTLSFNELAPGQTVTITYSVTAADQIPTDITTVTNVATDNGMDPVDPGTGLPIICPDVTEDCADTTTPLEGDTVIEKSVVDENGDGLVEELETLTYTLSVTNNTVNDAHDVVVRDSMVESLATWLTFNNDVTIDPSDIEYSGKLQNGDLTFDVIEAGQTVTISYSVTAGEEIPSDISTLTNVATDNGTDPVDPGTGLPIVCEEDNDCADTTTPLEGDTVIEKSVADASGEGLLQSGETLTYTLKITNDTVNDAHDVVVRDSMLEELPTWLTFNNDVTIDPSDIGYSGSLESGDFTFDIIEAGQSVTITYSVTAAHPLPADITEVKNVATDDGSNPIDPDINLPTICPEELIGLDCEDVTITVDPDEPTVDLSEGETVVEKSVADTSGDGLLQSGETLTYTLTVTNDSEIAAHDVVVRDSMLESTPEGFTFNDDVVINPSDIIYSGSLTEGNLTFAEVEPGEVVTITYSITADHPLPDDIAEVKNVVTDDGSDPIDPETKLPIVCPEELIGLDCEDVTITVDPDEPTIDLTEGETVVEKSVADASGDGLLQSGETLTYTLTVTNDTESAAHDIVVRDSMLESLPEGFTFNDDVVINPSDIIYSGSLTEGNLTFAEIEPGEVVTITYSITADHPLSDEITEVKNVVTDDGSDPIDPETNLPIICPEELIGLDCDDVTVTVDPEVPLVDPSEGDTSIEKSVVDENGDGVIQSGETLTYTLDITNTSGVATHDVVVRDSMLEALPTWLTFNNDVTINPSDIIYSGSLTDGNLTLAEIQADQTVTITYTVTAADELPTDVSDVLNVATDNGDNPIDPDTNLPIICAEDSEDCADTTTPLEGNTVIEKSVMDENGDGLVEQLETLTYTLTVTNNTVNNAHDVVVRDSMLESIPAGFTFNNDIAIDPSDIGYSGSLETGDLTFTEIEAGQTVVITYSVTATDELPADTSDIVNVATDNGDNPIDPDTNLPIVCAEDSEDCADTTTPLEGDTVIEKSVQDENGDGLAQESETLIYTLEVTNNTNHNAHDVVVRDSMLENMPKWLTFDNNVTIDPSDILFMGNLVDGNLTLPLVEAGQTVTISYSVTVDSTLPNKVDLVDNIATSNGQDPTTVDPELCAQDDDCSSTETPVEKEEKTLAITGGKSLFILFDLALLLIVSFAIKNKFAQQ